MNQLSLNLSRYRVVKRCIQNLSNKQKTELGKIEEKVVERLATATTRYKKAQQGSDLIAEAARSTTNLNELASLEDREESQILVGHALGGRSNFVHVYAGISTGIRQAWAALAEITDAAISAELMTADEPADSQREQMRDLSAELQLNRDVCERFALSCMRAADLNWQIEDMTGQIAKVVDGYRAALDARHSDGGVRVWHAPILTDFALTIYDNIAHHGEVSNTSTDTEISTYSLRKAEAVIDWIKDDYFREILLSETERFVTALILELRDIWQTSKELNEVLEEQVKEVRKLYFKSWSGIKTASALERKFDDLRAVDPNAVKFRDRSASLTEEERKDLEFKNEAISKICGMLRSDTPAHKIAAQVWDEVKRLKKHYLEVNSFYVCRIAQGNQMSGKSNGQLEVIPGKKPRARFEDIIGEGFDEVRAFVGHIAHLRKWAPLYQLTSPRRQADKANMLLIGPMGSGKTECMRAICNEEDGIAIFAAGSDFLTSWMGEAQKNPKRLFEAAVKLQKDSGRHVHILIDEIDEVLNNDRSTTNINLSLEFQMIMDGIVEYPNISVWGATNNPERIPMPMIRRFSKVLIVGRLNHEDRVKLFKQFLNRLPLKGFESGDWDRFADRMEGATGDVVRKVCDHVWREEIGNFIGAESKSAEDVLDLLSNMGAWGEESRSRRALERLRQSFSVQPKSVDRAIDIALDNVGIIHEIETAKQTYKNADEFLAVVRKQRKAKSE